MYEIFLDPLEARETGDSAQIDSILSVDKSKVLSSSETGIIQTLI